DDVRSVRVDLDVLLVEPAGVERVPDDSIQEGDVRSRPDRGVDVSDGSRAGEARVDDDELRVARLLRLDGPLESAGVVLGRIGAHRQDDVRILDVDPSVGHRPAAERGGQTGHRGTVSNPCLTVPVRYADRADE